MDFANEAVQVQKILEEAALLCSNAGGWKIEVSITEDKGCVAKIDSLTSDKKSSLDMVSALLLTVHAMAHSLYVTETVLGVAMADQLAVAGGELMILHQMIKKLNADQEASEDVRNN